MEYGIIPAPHPDCKAPHKSAYEWNGPCHACIGKGCPACSSRYNIVPQPARASLKRMARRKKNRATV